MPWLLFCKLLPFSFVISNIRYIVMISRRFLKSLSRNGISDFRYLSAEGAKMLPTKNAEVIVDFFIPTGFLMNLISIQSIRSSNTNLLAALKPSQVVDQLNKFIVGQVEAKRAVAIALRNRWRRHQLKDDMRNEASFLFCLEISNIMLLMMIVFRILGDSEKHSYDRSYRMRQG
jgi:hypothetical protein